ncbi:MAG: fibronectin type III domain-containing protein [Terracidiphilus sp.]
MMFAAKTTGFQPGVSGPWYGGTAAKAVALGVAAAMLSLPALGIVGRGSAPPSTPGDFHVTGITTSSVSFAWNASTTGAGEKIIYNIWNDTTGFSLNVGNVTSTTWTIGVQAGGTYSFHIEAISGPYGNLASAPSPEVTVTLLGTPLPTPVKPAPPVITQANPTANTITVAWTESTPANEINSYVVLVNGIADGGGPSGTTASTATGLASSYTFVVTVVAYSLNGTTGSLTTTSAPVTVTTAAATTPPAPASVLTAPTDLSGGGDGGGEAIILWNPSTSANEPQADILYEPYIDGVLDSFDSSVGDTSQVYIFPRGADEPATVWIVAVDNLGNVSAPSNVLTGIYF